MACLVVALILWWGVWSQTCTNDLDYGGASSNSVSGTELLAALILPNINAVNYNLFLPETPPCHGVDTSFEWTDRGIVDTSASTENKHFGIKTAREVSHTHVRVSFWVKFFDQIP